MVDCNLSITKLHLPYKTSNSEVTNLTTLNLTRETPKSESPQEIERKCELFDGGLT